MYSVDGQYFSAREPTLEQAIAAARERGIRPLCLCAAPAVPVYISRLGERHLLKRMPFSGSAHAVTCPHHEVNTRALAESVPTALAAELAGKPRRLRVSFALSVPSNAAAAATYANPSSTHPADGASSRMDLLDLLHYLWSEAELTRWHPGFRGKRTWAVVRSHLLAVASRTALAKIPLSDLLFVPEAYRPSDIHRIEARQRARFAARFEGATRARSLMILVAETKLLTSSPGAAAVRVKHLPQIRLQLSESLRREASSRMDEQIALWRSCPWTRLMTILTFGPDDGGQLQIRNLAFMMASRDWLPARNAAELASIERRVNEGRSFKTY